MMNTINSITFISTLLLGLLSTAMAIPIEAIFSDYNSKQGANTERSMSSPIAARQYDIWGLPIGNGVLLCKANPNLDNTVADANMYTITYVDSPVFVSPSLTLYDSYCLTKSTNYNVDRAAITQNYYEWDLDLIAPVYISAPDVQGVVSGSNPNGFSWRYRNSRVTPWYDPKWTSEGFTGFNDYTDWFGNPYTVLRMAWVPTLTH